MDERVFLLCKRFVKTLIKAALQPHVKGDTVKGDKGSVLTSVNIYTLYKCVRVCVGQVLPCSQLLKHQYIASHH